MTAVKDHQSFINQLIGKHLTFFGCEADILEFVFTDDLILHAMGFSRVICNHDILVTTLDYQSWDELDSKNNDEWVNVARFKDRILGGRVLSASINEINDLKIVLDNGGIIECLVSCSYPHYSEEREQWVLFEHTDDHSGRFLTAYNKRMELDPGPDSGE